MTRVGLIINPYSRHNRAGVFRRAVAEQGDAFLWVEPRTPAGLAEALTDFRRQGVRVVAVSGGDGTLRDVLTALPAVYGDDAPDIALMPAGKTNLAARVVGGTRRDLRGLRRLCDAARDGTLTRTTWPLLEVSWPDAPERRVRGFLFGAAAFAEGTRIAARHIQGAGVHNGLSVALSIAVTAAATLFGRRRRALLAGEAMRVTVDGAPARGGHHFITLATTLDRLVLGLTPFWGEGAGRLRWLDVAAPPQRLMAALVPVLRGRPRPWMTDAGYASGRADRLHIETDQPVVVDGEMFEPGAGGLVVSTTAPLGFVAP
ncbi:hypothetical protein F1188_17925 [Roseospira marina]|uniref:DAGKc domain-containing protein n=1 Tax=Roseospira marina TaxID=140057 RepID=A0A5M6I8N9_9PROT|nr:diacylglycerol kinase family protein [Roseospira marina]KAA5604068.1 hypothetical protein F1188_17925 [Roseospira marina]MBB4315864.1 hypothetical protein [Roseospira marina]MBB5088996.1 hypothetical protein [Roseospira marina]